MGPESSGPGYRDGGRPTPEPDGLAGPDWDTSTIEARAKRVADGLGRFGALNDVVVPREASAGLRRANSCHRVVSE